MYTEIDDKGEDPVQNDQGIDFDLNNPYQNMLDLDIDDQEETAAGARFKNNKNSQKNKLEDGLQYIYNFYSRQHQKIKKDEFLMAEK